MKYTLPLVLILCTYQVYSQNSIDQSITLAGIDKIDAKFEWGDVVVKNWDGPDLRIVGDISINLGENNDAFVLDIEKQDETLIINSTIKDWKSLPKYMTTYSGQEKVIIKVGTEKDVDWQDIKNRYGEVGNSYSFGVLVDIKLTVLVPVQPVLDIQSEYGSLEVVACSNPMNLKSIYGHLIADLDNRNAGKDCKLESTYSFVDVSIPENSGYDLTLETNYGEIYSDLNIQIDKTKSIDKIFETRVIGDLNNGGASLDIQATYNNVYLRKKI